MKTQYVAVKFHQSDKRSYIYTNALEPLSPGDTVEVPIRDGQAQATVEGVSEVAPKFPCKPIIRVTPKEKKK